MINFGEVPAGSVLPIPFDAFASATGASITLSGLATTDIEVYKGTSVTQRASDAGYALMDTDGIDLDGVTGIHGFSIDTGDNTDAGFYTVGSFFWVVVSSVTIDSQTVNFVAATFRLKEAETTAGRVEARVASIANGAITAAAIATDAIDDDALAANAVTAIQSGLSTLDAAGVRTAVGLASANLDTQLDALPTAAENATSVLTTAMTESYAADGATMTVAQALYAIQQYNNDRALAGVTMTVKKLDGTTTAYTLTVDDATNPTTVSRTG